MRTIVYNQALFFAFGYINIMILISIVSCKFEYSWTLLMYIDILLPAIMYVLYLLQMCIFLSIKFVVDTCSLFITSAKEVMFLPDFVCLSVCVQDNSKSYGRIFLKFWWCVGHGTNYQWKHFRSDLKGILDSRSLWNFRYHCVKVGIREPLAKWIWWRHLANNIALAEVTAGHDCFLVFIVLTRACFFCFFFEATTPIWQVKFLRKNCNLFYI